LFFLAFASVDYFCLLQCDINVLFLLSLHYSFKLSELRLPRYRSLGLCDTGQNPFQCMVVRRRCTDPLLVFANFNTITLHYITAMKLMVCCTPRISFCTSTVLITLAVLLEALDSLQPICNFLIKRKVFP